MRSAPVRRLQGSAKPQSAQAPLCGFTPPTVWAGVNAYALPYNLPKPSHTAGTLYDMAAGYVRDIGYEFVQRHRTHFYIIPYGIMIYTKDVFVYLETQILM
jgi:hypothetical protein